MAASSNRSSTAATPLPQLRDQLTALYAAVAPEAGVFKTSNISSFNYIN